MNGIVFRVCGSLAQAASTGGYLNATAGTTLANLYAVNAAVNSNSESYSKTFTAGSTNKSVTIDTMMSITQPSVKDGSTELITNAATNSGTALGQVNVYRSSGSASLIRVSRSSSTVTLTRQESDNSGTVSFVELYV